MKPEFKIEMGTCLLCLELKLKVVHHIIKIYYFIVKLNKNVSCLQKVINVCNIIVRYLKVFNTSTDIKLHIT